MAGVVDPAPLVDGIIKTAPANNRDRTIKQTNLFSAYPPGSEQEKMQTLYPFWILGCTVDRMTKEAIFTENAPRAIGPYSQAVKANGFLFISGQVPIDPETEDIKEGIMLETRQVLNNIKGILENAELDFSDVVKTTVYMTDLSLFNQMNEVYSEFFKEPYPARAAIQVAALPKGVSVEIEAIALLR